MTVNLHQDIVIIMGALKEMLEISFEQFEFALNL